MGYNVIQWDIVEYVCIYIYMYYIHPTAKRIMNDVVPMDPGV